MIVVVNGCFSSGKSTVCTSLVQKLPGLCFLDPDALGTFHPAIKPDGFDSYRFFWDSVEAVVKVMSSNRLSIVIQVAAATGVTSLRLDDFMFRMQRHTDRIYFFTLKPSFARVVAQDAKRTDVRYPAHIVEKCWRIINDSDYGFGKDIEIDDDTTPNVIVEIISKHISEGIGVYR